MMLQGLSCQWYTVPVPAKDVAELAAATCLPVSLAHVLYTRGLTTQQAVQDYLMSSQEKDVADPRLLKDAQKAVDRLIRAIENGEKILIAGDYDVDGITSSALMMICLLPLGAQVNFFLPNRVKDGYGLSVKTIERAYAHGYRVVITVDNGISAFVPAQRARELGIDLIITDHHRPHDHLPLAYAVVDPYQADCQYPYKLFAGVGVSFKVMALLYECLGKKLPEAVYELLLLGTVADVVPLTGENRFWVRHGLQKITQGHSYSLTVLKRNARFTKTVLHSLDIGFFITPQINALGRLQDPRAGVKFLVGSDTQETDTVGTLLHTLNQERKKIEKEIYDSVCAQVEGGDLTPQTDKIIIAIRDDWPAGVIGLVAGKLMHAYTVPAILLHKAASGILKGSCRSLVECDIFKALTSVSDLLLSFGGHPAAAGLSLHEDNLPAFKERITAYIQNTVPPQAFVKKITCDAPLVLPELNHSFMQALQYLEPFGHHNPQPLFVIHGVTLVDMPQLLKEQHVKAKIFADGIIKPIVFFNRPDIFEWLLTHATATFSVAAYVTENHWNGKVTTELQGVDIRLKDNILEF